jgi:putative FmdB family regulatory protein
MPFYEYECPACRYYLEVLQKISDKPLRKCPSCGKSGFKRLMSAPVFRLKGSGWYETDFKSDKDGQRNLAGAERDEAKTVAPEATKTDTSKPGAGKTETAKTAGGDQGGAGDKAKAPTAEKAKAGGRRTSAAPAAKARKASGSGKSAAKGSARRPSRTSARKGRR